MNEPDGKPPAAWLDQLHSAGHWNRLIEMARRSLASEPNDPDTHRHLAWAYARTKRFPEMWPHVEFLLKAEPEEPRNHHLAAVYFLDTHEHRKAQRHVDTLLRADPNSPTYHYLACIQSLRCRRVKDARVHVARARALAPHWAAAAHLEVDIESIGQRRAREAWARVRRLKETLALDPRNPDVLTAIGDTLFKQLERPREAEGFYRDALLIDPMNKACQEKLLDSIRARSTLYRTLSLPWSLVRAVVARFRNGKVKWWLVIHYAAVALAVGFRRLRARIGQWEEARRFRRRQISAEPEAA